MAILLLIAGLIVMCGPQAIAMLTPGPDRPGTVWRLCLDPDPCRPVDVSSLPLDAPITTLRTVFVADRTAMTTPLAVHLAATASAEVRWNGERIGANGRIGTDRAGETPGRFSAVIPVPQDRIRPGPNTVEIRLSAHHLWAPIVRPIHQLAIGPYRDPLRGTLRHYLPTLVLTGLLAFAFLGAVGLWVAGRRPDGPILTLLTGAVVAQAVVEASKLILDYAYPWQLARLAAIAGLAALAALALALIAQRTIPDRRLRYGLTAGLLVALAAALIGPPWWDAKALWAFRAGIAAVLIGAATGALGGSRKALWVQAACVVALGLSWQTNFLDGAYFALWLILFGWIAFTVVRTRRAATERAPEPIVSIPNGASRHLLKAGDLVHARADDDYSIVTLTDGRELLSTANLSALIRLAPDSLTRVHRSHAINPARIAAIHRSGRTVELLGGVRLPVGRTYWAALNDRMAEPQTSSASRADW